MVAYNIDIISEKLIDVVIRRAVGFKIRNFKIKASSSAFEQIVLRAIESTSKYLVNKSGMQLYCNICGKGPYTRKGMYLHLLRTHKYEIKNMIKEDLQELELAS